MPYYYESYKGGWYSSPQELSEEDLVHEVDFGGDIEVDQALGFYYNDDDFFENSPYYNLLDDDDFDYYNY